MPNIRGLTDWPDKVVVPRGSHLQEGVDAIRDLADYDGYDLRTRPKVGFGFRWLGKIVAKGPNGEDDYTDERYWIQRLSISAGTTGDGTDKISLSSDTTFDPSIYTATNLFELEAGTHSLAAGAKVEVAGWNDESGQSRWTIGRLATGQIFRVALSSTSGSAGTQTTTSSWVYTVTSLSGFQFATGATPERARRNGALAAATKGYAYFDTGGTLVLAEAWEGTSTGHC